MKRLIAAFAIAIASISIAAEPNPLEIQRIITPDIGSVVEITPGQEFYADTYLKRVESYTIDRPFKSSMGGSMGLPFSFYIDSTELFRDAKSVDGNWIYYVPNKFRSTHTLLGSVISPGDTVGLRVSKRGEMEWFVDNSIHNHMTTIWSRAVKPTDPQPKLSASTSSEAAGLPIYKLIFLGIVDNKIRVRFQQIDSDGKIVRDEFLFSIRPNGTAVGAIRGAEFVIKVGELRSKVVVVMPMSGEFGLAAPPSKAPPVPEEFKI